MSCSNNISLSSLSVDVFRIIQLFLSPYDYRLFMNADKTQLGSIKYETVYFNLVLKSSHRERTMSIQEANAILKGPSLKLNRLQQRVSDPSTQIGVKCNNIVASAMSMKNFHMFELKKLFFHRRRNSPIKESLFVISHLQLLQKLSLRHVLTMTSLENLPLNLKSLYLAYLPNLSNIAYLENMKALTKCSIRDCPLVQNVSSLVNISEIHLHLPWGTRITEDDLEVLQNGRYERFSFSSERPTKYDTSFVPALTKKLYFYAGIDSLLSKFSNVDVLALHREIRGVFNDDAALESCLTHFNGRILSLTGYSLRNVNEFTAPNLVELHLVHCIKIRLWLFLNDSSLKTVTLRSTFFSYSSQEEKDKTCRLLKKVKYFTIEDRKGLYDWLLIGLKADEDNIGSLSVKLIGTNCSQGFSPLNGIKKLEIIDNSYFISSKGLENIQHLVIINCENFHDDCSLLFENIHILILENLPYLHLLKGRGLKNLRYLKVVDCPHLMDIDLIPDSNLNHKQLVVVENCRKINEQDEKGKFEEMKNRFFSFHISRCIYRRSANCDNGEKGEASEESEESEEEE
jgi:hypothetical protein